MRSHSEKHHSENLRKAAVLVASLDRTAADALLNQMSPEQSQRLRRALVELGPIDPAEQSEVIEDFFRIGPLVPEKFPAGVDLDSRLADELGFAAAGGSVATPRVSHDHNLAPFRFLHETSGAELARYLEREHPQTIAVVVSHLPPERGADVLANLPASLQAEVARRLVDLEAADPDVVREVERGLQSWLAENVRSQQRRRAGLAALEGILQAADDRTQQKILSNLEVRDEQLVRRLGPRRRQLPTFDDVEQWDDASLALLLGRTDAEVIILALAGSSHEFVERVLAILPRPQAKALRYAIEHLGPTPLSDLEAARGQWTEAAYELQMSGELTGTAALRVSLAA